MSLLDIDSVSGRFRAMGADDLEFLKRHDSPTIANAIELLKLRDRTVGYLDGSIRCLFPELGVMVGSALTVTMDSPTGPVADRSGYWRMWESLDALPPPVVLVIADGSGAPARYAYFGEVMATTASKLGAVGVISDGGVRDLAEVRAMGLHYFASHTVVSHGNFRIVDVGAPVEIGGQRVETGDLLHGDQNGVVIVPQAALPDLPEAVRQTIERERAIIDYLRGPGATLAGLRELGGYGR